MRAIRRRERIFSALVRASSQSVWHYRPTDEAPLQHVTEEAAAWWREFAGQTEAQRIGPDGKGWLEAVHEADRDAAWRNWQNIVTTREPTSATWRARRWDGEWRWLEVSGVPIPSQDGEAAEWAGTIVDITERKRREANLAFLADVANDFNRLSSADEIMQTVGAKVGAHLHVARCSFVDVEETQGTLTVAYGWAGDETLHLPQTFRIEDYLTEAFCRASRVGETIVVRDTQTDPRTAAHAYARRGVGAFVTVPFQSNGQWQAHLSFAASEARDWCEDEIELLQELSNRLFPRIERARAEAALRERQAEIETLNARLKRAMQETHHRIKNNLQVIAALVEMQGYSDLPLDETALHRINAHVRALATIHDLLTQQAKGDASVTDLDAEMMLTQLIPMLQGMAADRRIRYDVEAIPLSVQQSGSLALLVNELVDNAIKHGTGAVEIALRRDGAGARLDVCDDGPGFPAGFDARAAAHTGLELVDNIVQSDLRGRIAYANRPEGGAQITVTFPIPTRGAGTE